MPTGDQNSDRAKSKIAEAICAVLKTKRYVKFLKLHSLGDVEGETEHETEEGTPDKQLATGAVLVPEVVDAHGDIISAEVIELAAHNFLAGYNSTTTIGVMHDDMNPPIELVESYIAPIDFVLGNQTITKGTWMITVRVNDSEIWGKIKDGSFTGFSIGGKATVEPIEPELEVA